MSSKGEVADILKNLSIIIGENPDILDDFLGERGGRELMQFIINSSVQSHLLKVFLI
ncbi:MAG: hypothetical protein PVF83_16600 [Anaerolineales bacterium]